MYNIFTIRDVTLILHLSKNTLYKKYVATKTNKSESKFVNTFFTRIQGDLSMSATDSHFSFVHLENPNHVLYMEKWQDEPIPFDDIDTHALFEATSNLFPKYLLEEEEEGGIPISSSNIGAKIFKDRKLLKERTWTDLGIFEKFLNETDLLSTKDTTILKSVYFVEDQQYPDHLDDERKSNLTIAHFLANGYNGEDTDLANETCTSPDMVNDSMFGLRGGDRDRDRVGEGPIDISLTSTSDIIGASNSFNMNIRSASTSSVNNNLANTTNNPIQTPRPPRTRQLSQDKNFQTPISRMIR